MKQKKMLLNFNKMKLEIIIAGIILLISLIIFRQYIFFGTILATQNGIRSDLLRINLPTYTLLYDNIRNGFGFWSWNMGIGTDILTHSDCIFDPFTYIMFLGGRDNIARLMVWSLIVKIIFEGITFSFYIKRFSKSSLSIVISSVLYAFCGYSLIMGNNLSLGTIMVYFPLALLGIEKLLENKSKKLLVVSICLIATTSFYSLFVSGVLLAIYLIVRCIQLKIKFGKPLLTLFILGILASFICALILLPQIYLLLSNTRVNAGKDVIINAELFKPSIKVLLTTIARTFGLNTLGDRLYTDYIGYINIDAAKDFYQVEAFVTCLVPLFFAQLWHYEKKERKQLVIWTVLFSIGVSIPLFSYVLNGFSTINYRWMFVIHIAECVLIAKSIDSCIKNGKVSISTLFISCFIIENLLIGTLFIILKYRGYNASQMIIFLCQNKQYYLLIALVYLIFIALSGLILIIKNTVFKKIVVYAASLIIVVIELFTNYSKWYGDKLLENNFQEASNYGYDDDSEKIIKKIQAEDNSFYRIYKDFDSVVDSYGIPSDNDAMAQNYYGLKSYSSQNNPSYVNFLQELGVYVACKPNVERLREQGVKPKDFTGATLNYINGIDDNYSLLGYLGVKYYLKRSNEDKKIDLSCYEYMYTIDGIDVFKNKNYNSLAFTNCQYMTEEEFYKLSFNDRINVLMNTTILDENAYTKVVDLECDEKDECQLIKFTNDKIEFDINIKNSEQMVCFSIPYDKNWTVYVDGKKEKMEMVNIGLSGVYVTGGNHKITVKYRPKAFIIGMILSVLSVTGTIIYINRKKIRKLFNKKNEINSN